MRGVPKIVSFGVGVEEPPLEDIFAGMDLRHEIPEYSEQGKPKGRKPKSAKGAKTVKKGAEAKKPAKKAAAKREEAVEFGECFEEEKIGFEEDPVLESLDPAPRSHKGKARRACRKSRKGSKARGAAQAKAKGLKRKPQAPAGASAEEPKPKKAKSKASKAKAKAKVAPAAVFAEDGKSIPVPQELGDWDVPSDCQDAPEGVTAHGVYSTAYRKAQSLSLSGDEARMAGKRASWLLRMHHKFSPSLSGIPRKAKKAEA